MSVNFKSIFRTVLLLCMLLVVGNIHAQNEIKGTVTDATGEPVINATVMEKGNPKSATVTDFDGNFTLKVSGKNPIEVSYIGMKTKTVDVKGKSVVNIKMEDDSNVLQEVVAIGYATVRKKDLTGSVASIGADKIAAVPVSNVSEAMTGKLAGVSITTTEGSPDADIKIRVRGGGSLSQDNSPLYIVDGFEVSSISDIAPSEIESIDVLKDASSTAIYGARGANGVIIVTTKSGKEGNVQVNFNASLGWKKLSKEVKVMNPYNYVAYQHEIGNTQYGNYEDLDIWQSYEGNNWQDQLFGRTGLQQQYNANVSGGTKEVKFNISYARNQEESIMKSSGYTKDNIGAKLNVKINKWLKLDFNARLAYQRIDGLSGGAETNQSNAANSIVTNSIRFRPVEPLSASDDDEETNSSSQKDPFLRIKATDREQRRFNQNYNAGLSWTPWKHFTFRSTVQFGWKYEDDNTVWLTDAVQNSKFGANGRPQLDYKHKEMRNWQNSNTASYDNKKFLGSADHHLNVLVGQEWSSKKQTNRENTSVNFPVDFNFDQVKAGTASGTALPMSTDILADENLLSFFGRVNYTYQDKYLATLNLRADGSSLFGEGNRWGVFPSLALAWRMTEEKFLSNVDWLSNLKLRLSFGTVGNNRISSGLLSTTYSMADNSGKAAYFDGVRSAMLQHNTDLYNPDLKWETTIDRDLGFDFGLFRGRINGTVDFYWKTTKDLLMRAEIPSSTGFSYQYQNFGKTSNKGIELTVNAAIIEKKDWNLNFNFNFAYNKNNIDELNNDNPWQSSNFAGSMIAKYEDYSVKEGGSLGEVWGYKTNGFFTAYDPVNNPGGELIYNGSEWKLRDGIVDNSVDLTGGKYYPGGLKYELDANGDPLKQKLGNTVAPVTGGFGLDGSYKTKFGTFDYNIFFNYSLGNKIVNGTKLAYSYFAGSAKGYNLVDDFELGKRYTWIDPNTGYNLAKPSSAAMSYYGDADHIATRLWEINQGADIYNPSGVTQMYINDWAVEDASFLRLNTLTIGYTLPTKWVKKAYLSNVRVYFTAYNLACWTSYSGYDPEVDTSSKKNAMCPGIDYAAYPKSRTFVGGINVTF